MATSPILDNPDPAPRRAEGRDTDALGPSDTSDSGSDVANVGEILDPGLPVDRALDDDLAHPVAPGGASGDATGTGERGSAAADGDPVDGSDIDVDRIVSPHRGVPDDTATDERGTRMTDDEDPDLGFVDAAQAGDPLEDEDAHADDDEGDEIDDDDLEASADTRGVALPPDPPRPNPEPDGPAPSHDRRPEDPEPLPHDDPDQREQRPGRARKG